MKEKGLVLISLLLVAIFVFFRLYKINTSLLFFNDMGRDFQVLLDWKKSGKPPLLGPQTSAVSFNQSAIYFYLLYPLFLITNSAFSSIHTLVILYTIAFIIGVYLFRNDKTSLSSLFICFLLISLQPQMIIQNRFIWNPSFVPLFLLISLFSLKKLLVKFNDQTLIVFTLSTAIAIALNFSVIPTVFAMLLVAAFYFKNKILKTLSFLVLAGVLTNLPTIAFEVRHKFALTELLIHGQTLKQVATSLSHKHITLLNYLFIAQNPLVNTFLLILIFFSLFLGIKCCQEKIKALNQSHNRNIDNKTQSHRDRLFALYIKIHNKIAKQRRDKKEETKILIFFSKILFISFLLTYLLPFNIESHYIFGILSILIFTISLLPKKVLLPILIILCSLWLNPKQTDTYFKPARRTVSQLQNCYSNFCQQVTEPLYVSMQSGILPYHNAPEHRFFMRQAGCQVLNIEDSQDKARLMAVVADDAQYEHNKTAYNELTLFGPSEQVDHFACQDNLQIYLLKKQ